MHVHAGVGHDRCPGGRGKQPHQAGRRRLRARHTRGSACWNIRSVPACHRSAGWRGAGPRDRRRGRPRDQWALGRLDLGGRRRQHGGHLAPAAGPAVAHPVGGVGDPAAASAARRLVSKAGVTVLQGAVRHHALMNALTPIQRDRGLRRLRRLTFGATAGALVAVVGVGYIAVASYAGKTSSTSSSTALSTTASTTTTTNSSSTSSSNSLQAPTQAPTTGSSGSGAVTSGGS